MVWMIRIVWVLRLTLVPRWDIVPKVKYMYGYIYFVMYREYGVAI